MAARAHPDSLSSDHRRRGGCLFPWVGVRPLSERNSRHVTIETPVQAEVLILASHSGTRFPSPVLPLGPSKQNIIIVPSQQVSIVPLLLP